MDIEYVADTQVWKIQPDRRIKSFALELQSTLKDMLQPKEVEKEDQMDMLHQEKEARWIYPLHQVTKAYKINV